MAAPAQPRFRNVRYWPIEVGHGTKGRESQVVTAGVGIEGVRAKVERVALLSQRLIPPLDASSIRELVVEAYSLHATIKDVHESIQDILNQWDILTPDLKDRLRRIAEANLEQLDEGYVPSNEPGAPPHRVPLLVRWATRGLDRRVRESREMLLDLSDSIFAHLEMDDDDHQDLLSARLGEVAATSRRTRLLTSEEVAQYVSTVLRD